MGISREQALDCLRSDDLIGIGMEAGAVRRRLHPEGVVSYAVEAEIACDGRAVEAIEEEVGRLEELGAGGVVLTGAGGSVEALELLVRTIKSRHAGVWLQALSLAELERMPDDGLVESLTRLRAAGLDAVGGLQPEIVDEAWLRMHRAAHRAGMQTTANIVFGAGETYEQRLDRLAAILQLQRETKGFVAVSSVSFHAGGGRELDETTAVEYLKMLAVTRLFLDEIENVQADWKTQGLKVLQMGLRFGANDVGWVHAEKPGVATEEELRRVIRDAGFKPVQREAGFRTMLLAG